MYWNYAMAILWLGRYVQWSIREYHWRKHIYFIILICLYFLEHCGWNMVLLQKSYNQSCPLPNPCISFGLIWYGLLWGVQDRKLDNAAILISAISNCHLLALMITSSWIMFNYYDHTITSTNILFIYYHLFDTLSILTWTSIVPL